MTPPANEDLCANLAQTKLRFLEQVVCKAMAYTLQAIFATSAGFSGRPLPQGLRIVRLRCGLEMLPLNTEYRKVHGIPFHPQSIRALVALPPRQRKKARPKPRQISLVPQAYRWLTVACCGGRSPHPPPSAFTSPTVAFTRPPASCTATRCADSMLRSASITSR